MFNLKFANLITLSLAAVSMTLGTASVQAVNTTVPPGTVKTETAPSGAMDMFQKAKERVSDFFTRDPSISTLEHALKAADMASLLHSKEPITIFAPNNAAFAKLPADTMKKLFQKEGRDQLVAILKSHVVKEKINPKDLKSMKVMSVSGKELDIVVNGSDITVNGAKVIKSEQLNDNVEVFVIDTVLQ